MRWVILTLFGFSIYTSGVAAQAVTPDVVGCEIEEWSFGEDMGRLFIEGTTTCREGRLDLAVYNDETREMIAEDFTYIMNHEFELYLNAEVPSAMMIEYTIE